MKRTIGDAAVRSYLSALEARLGQLPADQSEEILFGVQEHIAEAQERGGQSTAEILAGLGSPDDIAAGLAGTGMDTSGPHDFTKLLPGAQFPPGAPQNQPSAQRFQSSTLWVVATVILLPFGAFLAGIGWLFGVAGLWMGTRWKLWEKILGTVLIPGGVPGALFLAILPVRQTLSFGSPGDEVIISDYNPLGFSLPELTFVVIFALPILVALYLLIVGLIRRPKLT